jgi:hypothetical protein
LPGLRRFWASACLIGLQSHRIFSTKTKIFILPFWHANSALRKLLSATREELSALMPSILDKAFSGYSLRVRTLRRLCPCWARTPSVRRTSSPEGDASRSAWGVLCPKGLSADIKWSVQRASPLGVPIGHASRRWEGLVLRRRSLRR